MDTLTLDGPRPFVAKLRKRIELQIIATYGTDVAIIEHSPGVLIEYYRMDVAHEIGIEIDGRKGFVGIRRVYPLFDIDYDYHLNPANYTDGELTSRKGAKAS